MDDVWKQVHPTDALPNGAVLALNRPLENNSMPDELKKAYVARWQSKKGELVYGRAHVSVNGNLQAYFPRNASEKSPSTFEMLIYEAGPGQRLSYQYEWIRVHDLSHNPNYLPVGGSQLAPCVVNVSRLKSRRTTTGEHLGAISLERGMAWTSYKGKTRCFHKGDRYTGAFVLCRGHGGITTSLDVDKVATYSDFVLRTGLPTEVAFVAEKKRLYFNKEPLCEYSDYFENMFKGAFAESVKNEIELPEEKFDDFQELLRCLHLRNQKPISDQNVHRLMEMADFYHIPNLMQRITDFLVAQWRNGKPKACDILPSLIKAYKYDLRSVVNAILPFALRLPSSELKKLGALLPAKVYTEILEKRLDLFEGLSRHCKAAACCQKQIVADSLAEFDRGGVCNCAEEDTSSSFGDYSVSSDEESTY